MCPRYSTRGCVRRSVSQSVVNHFSSIRKDGIAFRGPAPVGAPRILFDDDDFFSKEKCNKEKNKAGYPAELSRTIGQEQLCLKVKKRDESNVVTDGLTDRATKRGLERFAC